MGFILIAGVALWAMSSKKVAAKSSTGVKGNDFPMDVRTFDVHQTPETQRQATAFTEAQEGVSYPTPPPDVIKVISQSGGTTTYGSRRTDPRVDNIVLPSSLSNVRMDTNVITDRSGSSIMAPSKKLADKMRDMGLM